MRPTTATGPTIFLETDQSADRGDETWLVTLSMTWGGFADAWDADDFAGLVREEIERVEWPKELPCESGHA